MRSDKVDPSDFESIKSYVYGLGRGVGIRVQPRHHLGDFRQQVYSIATDVLEAVDHPSNEELGEPALAAYRDLQDAIDSNTSAEEVALKIQEYVLARCRELNRNVEE